VRTDEGLERLPHFSRLHYSLGLPRELTDDLILLYNSLSVSPHSYESRRATHPDDLVCLLTGRRRRRWVSLLLRSGYWCSVRVGRHLEWTTKRVKADKTDGNAGVVVTRRGSVDGCVVLEQLRHAYESTKGLVRVAGAALENAENERRGKTRGGKRAHLVALALEGVQESTGRPLRLCLPPRTSSKQRKRPSVTFR
jgi:hypothetical protein